MTKHNGKARRAGDRVGTALQNRNRKGGPVTTSAMFRHTTDINNVQSVLERNDLEELMAMADLADRDFTAERAQVVVISTGTVDPLAEERDARERREAEDRHRHRLKLPRRPMWTSDMTPEQLDLQERSAFLLWRRELASLEEEEKLVLTPFERNLEVWRQLWRVLERSDIVVQVVDARDPLLYRCTDLEAYAREIHDSKSSFILLNKADLLPEHVRRAWADHFDEIGLDYAFWSAFQVTQNMQQLKAEAAELGVDVYDLKAERKREQEEEREALRRERGEEEEDERIRVLDGEELLELLEYKARLAVEAAGPDDPRHADPNRRLVVGLVGYPNVGKSSTINALFGSKKTAVAPTPGKTKHFQTLNVSASMCLCDCPGLVMPVFANSKSEMVAAGVIPIDRLTDIRAPVEVVAKRLGRWQLENCYGFKLPPVAPHEPPSTPPTALQLLRALAVRHGWTAGSGLPDESRAGRLVLRDYTSGKLVYCVLPPSTDGPKSWVPSADDLRDQGPSGRGVEVEDDADEGQGEEAGEAGPGQASEAAADDTLPTTSADIAAASVGFSRVVAHTKYTLPKFGPPVSDRPAAAPVRGAAASSSGRLGSAAVKAAAPGGVAFDAADLDMLQGMEDKPKDKRPDYKFQKKIARSKGDRGQERGEGVFDGGAMVTGKKGGLVRVSGY